MFIPTTGRLARSALVLAFLLFAAACGAVQPTSSPPPTASPPPTQAPSPTPPAATLLLEVTNEGGFINPAVHIAQLPAVVVDADGKIYLQNFGDGSLKLIPGVIVRDVGEAGAAAILAAIRDAGLDHEGNAGGVVGDIGVTVFTVVIDGETIVNRIAASGPGRPGHPGGANQPVFDLLARLTDLNETWGATEVTTMPYQPIAYRVYAAPATAAAGSTIDWPLDTALADFGSPQTPDFGVAGLRSGIVLGADADALAAALATADSQATFISGGDPYQVWVRPLLPDELG